MHVLMRLMPRGYAEDCADAFQINKIARKNMSRKVHVHAVKCLEFKDAKEARPDMRLVLSTLIKQYPSETPNLPYPQAFHDVTLSMPKGM